MKENRENVTEDVKSGGIGREHTADQQEQNQQYGNEGRKGESDKAVQDISEIDQQEGNMNHGTTGIKSDDPGNEKNDR